MKIIRLGLPILIGQLGMIIVGFADTKMVGLYSTDALAAASFVNNIFNVAFFTCVGFTYGLTPLIGALYAHRDANRIGAMLRNGMLANTIFALFVSLVMVVVYFNLDHLGQPEELLPLIRPYYLLYVAGIVPIALFNAFAQWAYAINRTRMPMWIILIANVLNIIGNFVLIYGYCGFPELGLIGAGIATFTSRIFCVLVIILIFCMKGSYAEYRRGYTSSRITSSNLRQISLTSWPISLQMTFESSSFAIAAVIVGWFGAVSLAAYQVIMILGTLGFCIYYSIGSAVSVLVANAAGASDRKEMRRVAWNGYVIILILAAIASVIFVTAGEPIIRQFTTDSEVIAASLSLVGPLVLYQLGDATQINFANSLRGTANVRPLLWIAFFCYMVAGLIATYLMAFVLGMGVEGVVLSFSVSLFMAGGLMLYFFLRTTRPAATEGLS